MSTKQSFGRSTPTVGQFVYQTRLLFLLPIALTANIAANVANNANSNNNNNNNNDNQDNQNTLNFNQHTNENSNMNMNMLMMAMGRSFINDLNNTHGCVFKYFRLTSGIGKIKKHKIFKQFFKTKKITCGKQNIMCNGIFTHSSLLMANHRMQEFS